MPKIEITLDAAKIRGLITNREYTNKENAVVKVQEVKFELVEVKEPKTVVSGAWGEKKKTHFCAAIQTKEQREAKEPTISVGDGFTTYFANQTQPTPVAATKPEGDGLPF